MFRSILAIIAISNFLSVQAAAQEAENILEQWDKDPSVAPDENTSVIDPKNLEARLRHVSKLSRNGDMQALEVELTHLIALHPRETRLLYYRADTYRAIGNYQAALADAAAALKIDSSLIEARIMRAILFRDDGMPAEALSELATIEKTGRHDIEAQLAAGRIYSSLGEYSKAAQAFDRAIRLDEQSGVYLHRSLGRPKTDFVGRLADIEKALTFPLNRARAYEAKGELLRSMGDLPGSIAAYSAGLLISPTNSALLTERGISQMMAGNTVEADKDFGLARVLATTEVRFHAMCSAKAMAGVGLVSALEECNIALGVSRLRTIVLDTRGLVFLRMGRLDEAIRDYDEVLSTGKRSANSYLGRAIAWSRKGDAAKAAVDLAAARRANPNVENEFAYYGVTMP